MRIAIIKGHTRVIGEAQGYIALPLLDTATPEGVPCMLSAWLPTPEETLAIVAGAPVILSVLGTQHPPVMITVGEVPA